MPVTLPDNAPKYGQFLATQAGTAGVIGSGVTTKVYANVTGAPYIQVFGQLSGAATISFAWVNPNAVDRSPQSVAASTSSNVITSLVTAPASQGQVYGGSNLPTTNISATANTAFDTPIFQNVSNWLQITIQNTAGANNTVSYLDVYAISYSGR